MQNQCVRRMRMEHNVKTTSLTYAYWTHGKNLFSRMPMERIAQPVFYRVYLWGAMYNQCVCHVFIWSTLQILFLLFTHVYGTYYTKTVLLVYANVAHNKTRVSHACLWNTM